jgi:hypothetical protein
VKRKRQPTADRMREQLALAADEIISLRQIERAWMDAHEKLLADYIALKHAPLWQRLANWWRA